MGPCQWLFVRSPLAVPGATALPRCRGVVVVMRSLLILLVLCVGCKSTQEYTVDEIIHRVEACRRISQEEGSEVVCGRVLSGTLQDFYHSGQATNSRRTFDEMSLYELEDFYLTTTYDYGSRLTLTEYAELRYLEGLATPDCLRTSDLTHGQLLRLLELLEKTYGPQIEVEVKRK